MNVYCDRCTADLRLATTLCNDEHAYLCDICSLGCIIFNHNSVELMLGDDQDHQNVGAGAQFENQGPHNDGGGAQIENQGLENVGAGQGQLNLGGGAQIENQEQLNVGGGEQIENQGQQNVGAGQGQLNLGGGAQIEIHGQQNVGAGAQNENQEQLNVGGGAQIGIDGQQNVGAGQGHQNVGGAEQQAAFARENRRLAAIRLKGKKSRFKRVSKGTQAAKQRKRDSRGRFAKEDDPEDGGAGAGAAAVN